MGFNLKEDFPWSLFQGCFILSQTLTDIIHGRQLNIYGQSLRSYQPTLSLKEGSCSVTVRSGGFSHTRKEGTIVCG